MNRHIKGFLMTALLAGLPVGCSNPGAEETTEANEDIGEAIEIDFLHIIPDGEQGQALTNIIDSYHASQDEVRVNSIFVEGSYEGVVERLQSLAVTDQLPDITMGGFTYTNFMLENMPVVSVQDYIDKENFDTSDFFPTMLDLARGDDGEIKGLPFAVSTPVVYYNKDMFEEAGIDAEDSVETYEDVRNVANQLTSGDVNGVYYNYGITGNWLFQAMVESMGGNMVAGDYSSVMFHEEEGVKTLQYWVDLMNKDETMPNINDQQAKQAFASGNLAMYIGTPATFAPMQAQSDFEMGLLPFPTDGEHDRKVPAGGNNLFILEGAEEEQDAAWDFMKFATSPESTTEVAEKLGYMAVRQSPVDDPDLLGTYYEETPAAYVPYEQVDDMVPWHNFPGEGGSEIFTIVQDNIQAALNEQLSPEEALNTAAEQANEMLD